MKYLFSAIIIVAVSTLASAQSSTAKQSNLEPGWWQIPQTNFKIKFGGYVKFDLIQDFNPIGSPYYFDVSEIPTTPDSLSPMEGQNSTLNARETRLHLDVRSQTKVGEIRGYVEGDFYGSGGSFRMRHAFVEINGKWLAGQWWSNFMDESIIPKTLDFEKPAAYAFARHAMIRYKHSFKNSYLAVALEQPSGSAQAPAQPGNFENPLPDLTARYRVTKDWGHVQLSGFAAALRYRFTDNSTEDVSLFGVNLSGQLNIAAKDNLIYQVVYGPGVGRFRGGMDAALDANGKLKPLTDLGVTVGYQHFWSPAFSSVIVGNFGQVDNTEGQPKTDLKSANYFAANLVWYFAENALVGVEYLRGNRTDFSESTGVANRLQFSVKYSFN